MKRIARTPKTAPMSADAYAGFLKLWLTPSSRLPAASPDLDAYLRHVSEREPLSAAARRVIRQPTEQAA